MLSEGNSSNEQERVKSRPRGEMEICKNPNETEGWHFSKPGKKILESLTLPRKRERKQSDLPAFLESRDENEAAPAAHSEAGMKVEPWPELARLRP